MENKEKFMVFTFYYDIWKQDSIELDSFEQAEKFCENHRRLKLKYMICKIIKQGDNGN